MRIASGLLALALTLGHVTPAFAAFSKDIVVTSVVFSADLDTATIMLSKDPGEQVHVAYDLYLGNSPSAVSGGGTNQRGPAVTMSGMRNAFASLGNVGGKFRLQYRVCPYDEPYTGHHTYQYCSQEFVTYVTYDVNAGSATPSITNATVSGDKDSITVQLSAPIQKGFIRFERWGSGNGADYGSLQYRADGQKTVVLGNLLLNFAQSGTAGKQTITLRPCTEVSGTANGTIDCGPTFPVTIYLDGSSSFRDVPASHPNAEAIRFVQEQGIVAGYSNGTFQPDTYINRAEFTKLVTLYKFGQEMVDLCATRIRFSDVPRDAWYEGYICRAQDSHLIDGYPDGTFRPASHINVAEAMKIIVLADVFGSPEKNSTLSSSENIVWYEAYVRYLAERAAIPTSIVRADARLTRGEMAEVVYRLKANITTKPSRFAEELIGSNPSTSAQYMFLTQPTSTLKNYARNAVYRYAVTAPETQSYVMTSETFNLSGGRWAGPQIGVYTNANFTNQIDTWASDDNWTMANGTTLKGSVTIPPGERRYIALTVNVGIPADMGFLLSVKHSLLPQVTLTDGR